MCVSIVFYTIAEQQSKGMAIFLFRRNTIREFYRTFQNSWNVAFYLYATFHIHAMPCLLITVSFSSKASKTFSFQMIFNCGNQLAEKPCLVKSSCRFQRQLSNRFFLFDLEEFDYKTSSAFWLKQNELSKFVDWACCPKWLSSFWYFHLIDIESNQCYFKTLTYEMKISNNFCLVCLS